MAEWSNWFIYIEVVSTNPVRGGFIRPRFEITWNASF